MVIDAETQIETSAKNNGRVEASVSEIGSKKNHEAGSEGAGA